MSDLSLENMNLSTVDASRWSDVEVPSLSIDDDIYDEKEFYIKEHTDKLEKLRKENFDLKLKLYLLETDGNFNTNKEMKLKVIQEFNKKDDEVKKLQKLLEKRNKDNTELKLKIKKDEKLRNQHYEDYLKVNDDLRSRISSAVGIFLDLIDAVEELTKLLRNNHFENEETSQQDENIMQEKISKTVELLKRSSKFIVDNSEHLSEHLESKKVNEKITELRQYEKDNFLNLSQIDAQEICAKEFLNIVSTFKKLLEDFRTNRINYRQFSDKMDPLFEKISSQNNIFESLYLDQLDANKKIRELQAFITMKDNEKQMFDKEFGKSLTDLDAIILKAKNASV